MTTRSYIDRNRIVTTFTDLIRINSPSFGEAEIGDYLTSRLRSLGCEVIRQDYGRSFNLIGRKKGTGGPPLMLSGHMDTIEPTLGITFSEEDGIVRSTGSTVLGADDKSAIAQILEALEALDGQGLPHGDIEVVFSSAEETGLCGARNLDFGLIRSRHGLILDSGGPVGKIIVGAPTHITYEMRITGRAAHAGIEPERGVSAIRAAAEVIAAVPDGRIDPKTTANIGIIAGGTATNVVPREVLLKGEMRSLDAAALAGLRERIFGAARSACDKAGVRLDIDEHEEYLTFTIPAEEPFLAFMRGTFRRCGIEPVEECSGGGSDANVFNHNGICALNLSTGMQKVHSHEEYIAVDDLHAGAAVVLQAILDFRDFQA